MQNDHVLQVIVGSLSLTIRNMAQLIAGLTALQTGEVIREAIAQAYQEILSMNPADLDALCTEMSGHVEQAINDVPMDMGHYSEGMPLYWRNETSGRLAAAIGQYLLGTESTAELTLVRDYFAQYVNAPCHDANPHHTDESRARLAQLREAIAQCALTREALNEWQLLAIAEGIDPL